MAGVVAGGCAQDSVGGAGFDDAAWVHDDRGVVDLSDDREAAGDEQVGHAELGPQVGEQVEDLPLDRYVEGGDGLVKDEYLRVAGQRADDGHALPLATGQ